MDRNPQRIKDVVALISAVWKQFPELRLGQLLSNAIGGDIFYIEDTEVMEKLAKYCEENS